MSRVLSIGPRSPVLIVAEIGVNHDGSPAKAMKLLHAAKQAGADAVKLQLFRADRLMHPSCGLAKYQKNRMADAGGRDLLRRYELSDQDVHQLAKEAARLKLWLLATAFSPGDLELAASLALPALKVASPDLVNKPLLRQACSLGCPLLLSTGAATLEEIDTTIIWLLEWGTPFALLHCISSYPTSAGQANLCWIAELRERYGVPVGFSDHTTEITAGALAVAVGAKLIEKHLTYNRAAAGPDHAASFDPKQFAEYVRLIRTAETMLGKPGKHVLKIEQDVRRISRQSLVMARDVPAGARIAAGDLTVQRPGTGIPAAEIDEVVGGRAVRNLRAGAMVRWRLLEKKL